MPLNGLFHDLFRVQYSFVRHRQVALAYYVVDFSVKFSSPLSAPRALLQVVRADSAVGLRPGARRDLRVPAVRQGDAGADDRELHVPPVPLRPAPRGVVELLRPVRCVVAADAAEAAADGPGEPVQQRGGSPGAEGFR